MKLEKGNSLNTQQLELLQLFSRELPPQDWLEIKRLIVKYLAEKISTEVDKQWKEKDWEGEALQQFLENPKRTSYNPKNEH